MLIAGILGLAAVLLLADWRMHSHAFHLAVFAGFPALMVALAGRLEVQGITWFKIFSLCAGILLIHFAPSLRTELRGLAGAGIYALLVLNIAGPAVYDAIDRRWFAAALAVAIIVMVPRWNAITYTRANGHAVVSYDIPWLWIAAYTLWNAGFVTTAYPTHTSDHLAVLTAPLVIALCSRDRRSWLRHRAFTLSLYGVMVVAAIEVFHLGWIPAAAGLEKLHGPLISAAWILLACHLFVRLRNRAPRPIAAGAAAR